MTDEVTNKPTFLTDSDGTPSSKRLFALGLLTVGLAMGIFLFMYDVLNNDINFNTAYNVFQTFLIAGSSILGLSTIDKLQNIFTGIKKSPPKE